MAQATDHKLTTDERLALKVDAEKLLNNRVFLQICEELDTQYYKRWADNLDQIQREALWFQADAVREILRLVKSLATERVEYEH
jgi:hypothetical protein